ncbi:MAG: ACT domain-containing protein [Bacteroidales bacterium]|nr:ACT domain-containing protein [Bacteroidales bacterium]
MIVRSFYLKRQFADHIAALCTKDAVAVIRPERAIEALFSEAISVTIDQKKNASAQMESIREYFYSLEEAPQYREKVNSILDTVSGYLREAMYVQTERNAIQDYVMAKCARLCAEAVSVKAGGSILDGTELMISHSVQHFDWQESQAQIRERCMPGQIIPGGYGRLTTGYIVRVGKDGAHLMASLIGATLEAESIEFYVDGKAFQSTAMTYDEAAHYCSQEHAPFASSAVWPAKNAGIPIVVKDITDPSFEGTLISGKSANSMAVILDRDLDLITVYGTGLLGRVGMSGAIFSCLAQSNVNVRFIAQTSSEYSISFAVKSADKDRCVSAIQSLFKDNPLLPLDDVVVANQQVGIVTVFGSRMRNLPGTSAAIFGKLGAAGINIIASAQGGEELSISVVVDASDAEKAAELLK